MANYVSTKAYSGKGATFNFNLNGSSPRIGLRLATEEEIAGGDNEVVFEPEE
jgi:hypothetical protein